MWMRWVVVMLVAPGCHRTPPVIHQPGETFVVHASGRSQGAVIEDVYKRAAAGCPAGFDVVDRATDSRSVYWRSEYVVTEIRRP